MDAVTDMTKTFETRSGLRFTVEIMEDIGHALVCRVINGKKSFVGKTLPFPKHDMAEVL